MAICEDHNDSLECYGYIKIVYNNDIVSEPPTYKAMEPDMSQIKFVIGQKFSPLIEQIREKLPDAKIAVTYDDRSLVPIRHSHRRQHILIAIANNNRVYEPPKFIRFPA